jgi:hypothetical protein
MKSGFMPASSSKPTAHILMEWGGIGHGIGGKDIPTKMARLAKSQMLE